MALDQCQTIFYLALDLKFGVESMPNFFFACFGVGSGFLALGNDLFWRWIGVFGVGRKRPMPKVGIGECLGWDGARRAFVGTELSAGGHSSVRN